MGVNDAVDWYDSLDDDISYKIEKNKNAFAVLLNALMMEQNVNRTELARRLNKSAPYVSKVLRGDENLTISSMTKLLGAIDCDLHIKGCHKNHEPKWFNVIAGVSRAPTVNDRDKSISKTWAEKVRYGKEAA